MSVAVEWGEKDFYTVAEAAKKLGVSASTVWRWIKSGELAAYRVGPKNIRIRKEDLQAVVKPAREELREPGTEKWRQYHRPPTPEQLARRRELFAKTMEEREKMNIAPLTSVDLIRIAREQKLAREEGEILVHKMSPTEAEDQWAVIRKIRALQEQMLARRGGKLFPPSWIDINEAREERTEDL